MTVPRWFIPLISVIAAVAVGVAATLLGMRFAAPVVETTTLVPQTETVPVIAPISPELAEAGFPIETDAGTYVSEAVGEAEVVVPIGDDLAVSDLIAEADETAASPLLPVAEDDPAESTEGAAPREVDPCASDAPPADCEGLSSTIAALTAAPPFDMTITPLDGCGTSAPEGSFQFGWRTTQPASFTVTAWRSIPDEGPFGIPLPSFGGVLTTTFEVSASDGFAWELARGADVPAAELPVLYDCGYLAGVEEDTYYSLQVTGVSWAGETITRSFEISSRGAFARRTMVLTSSSGSGGGWTASLVHGGDEQFGVRAYAIGSASGNCETAPARFEEVPRVYRTTVTLGERQTEALGVTRDQNQHTVYAFMLSPGQRVLFCGEVYRSADAPSWERGSPIRAYVQVAQSADYLLPQLAVSGVELYRDDVTVTLSASTANGYACGSTTLDGSPIGDIGEWLLLCIIEHFGARWDPATRDFGSIPLAERITLVVRAQVELPGGETLTSSTALDLPYCSYLRRGCALAGEFQQFQIVLPGERTSSSLCGSSFGDCTPPTTETATGIVEVTAGWENTWRLGEGPRIEAPLPVEIVEELTVGPRMETSERITYAGVDPVSGGALVTLQLETDQPADYRVELRGVRDAEPCSIGGAALVATGRTEGSTLVTIPAACFNGLYLATVTLTGDDGAVSTWANSAAAERWLGSLLLVPKLEVEVTYGFRGTAPEGSALDEFVISLDGRSLGAVNNTGTCLDEGILTGSGRTTVSVSSNSLLELELVTRPIRARSGTFCLGGGSGTPDHPDYYVPMYLDTAALLRAPLGTDIVVGSFNLTLTFRVV